MPSFCSALCITTLSACSQRPHQRKYSTPSSFTAPPQMAYLQLPPFPHRWRYRPPSPSPFPYTRKTYISRQQTNMAASRTAASQGDARSATLFLGRGPPKLTVGFSIPPAQKYIGRGAHPSLSQPKPTCRSPTLGKQWSHCHPQP